eukprot:jgi/Astpho2/8641/Aster-05116
MSSQFRSLDDTDQLIETLEVDSKSWYTLGRDPGCDIRLHGSGISSQHAALVHHSDGRLYVIDLKSDHGTFFNKRKLVAHKPTAIPNGTTLTFGSSGHKLVVLCEQTGEKRRAEGMDAGSEKRQRQGKVQASHLLVKHKDVRRPSSWKEPHVTRTKTACSLQEEALQMIENFHQQLTSGEADFTTLASKESHCSSAKRGGDLGKFEPGTMMPAFEEATYALKVTIVGELSGPVYTDSGVHLILRTAMVPGPAITAGLYNRRLELCLQEEAASIMARCSAMAMALLVLAGPFLQAGRAQAPAPAPSTGSPAPVTLPGPDRAYVIPPYSAGTSETTAGNIIQTADVVFSLTGPDAVPFQTDRQTLFASQLRLLLGNYNFMSVALSDYQVCFYEV